MSKRPILILGAGSDIGVAIARRFAEEGYPVQLAARDPALLETTCKDMAVRGEVAASAHRYDALAVDEVDGFLDGLPETPCVVVSLVGLLGNQQETERDPAQARKVSETNFLGPLLVLEAAAERLVGLDEPAAIIGVSSVAGDRGRATNYWYGASKAAFTAGLSGLRQKYAGTKLLVMTVKPGFVDTKMTEGMDLIGPLTDSPEDIAEMVWRGFNKRHRIVSPWKWRLVMTVIKSLPERIFERLKF